MNSVTARSRDQKHQRRIHTNSPSRVLSPRSPFFSQKSQSRFHGVLRPSALKQIFKVFNWSARGIGKEADPKTPRRRAPENWLTKPGLQRLYRRQTSNEIPVMPKFFQRTKRAPGSVALSS